MILGPESEIVFRAEAERRHVVLARGDAYFDVATNPDKPFYVYAGTVAVKVVGTRFDVRRQPSSTSVAVVEGIVEVYSPSANVPADRVTLLEGQRARVDRRSSSFQLDVEQDIEVSQLATWRQGRLVYKSAQLQDIIADANRYSTSGQLLLANEAMQSEQVTLSLSVDLS